MVNELSRLITSQIWSLIFCLSTSMILVPNSTPIVWGHEAMNFFSVNWCSRQDFPTPMSPAKRRFIRRNRILITSCHGRQLTNDYVLEDVSIAVRCTRHRCDWKGEERLMSVTTSIFVRNAKEFHCASSTTCQINTFIDCVVDLGSQTIGKSANCLGHRA